MPTERTRETRQRWIERDPTSEPTKRAIDELAVAVAELSMHIARLERRLAQRTKKRRPPATRASRGRE